MQVVNKDNKSRGFGFVAFEDPEAAEQAVKELNGKEIIEGKVRICPILQNIQIMFVVICCIH